MHTCYTYMYSADIWLDSYWTPYSHTSHGGSTAKVSCDQHFFTQEEFTAQLNTVANIGNRNL